MLLWLFRLIIFVIILLTTVEVGPRTAAAQEPYQWSPPSEHIPGYDDRTWTPYLVADRNRTVHAFNSIWLGDDEQRGIVYSQWSLEEGWTEPIDILLPVIKREARIKGVALDGAGMIHVLFFSGDETEANIYYSRAPLTQAGNAWAWSSPQLIGNEAIIPDTAALVSAGEDRLIVTYGGDVDRRGLFGVYSLDGGDTWSEPSPVFLTYTGELFPIYLQMLANEQGEVHAIWTVNNSSGTSEAFYYAKLEADQVEWNEPVRLVGGGINQPSLVEYENELFIIHHDGNPTTRHMRRSLDGGQTWSEPVRLFPHVGSNGPPSLVVDGNNVLHMFFGNRVTIDRVIRGGMWHSVWQNGHWSPPVAIVSGNQEGFDPSFARAIISQGNVILLTWMTDPGKHGNGVESTYYSYTVLDAPEWPVVAFPTPTMTPTARPTPTSTPLPPTPTPTPRPVFTDSVQNQDASWLPNNPAAPVIVSIVPILLIVVIVLSYQFFQPFDRR